jgi:hypothetical protein
MPPSSEPALSVVVVTRDEVATVRRFLDHLRRQTSLADIEVVLVGPSPQALAGADALLSGFTHAQSLVCEGTFTRGSGTELGVRRARAALIALTEDHCYPDDTWAERLLAAYDERWAALGASVRNANPATTWSRVNHDLAYGRWSPETAAGEIDDIPGFNSVFTRASLLALGDDLERLLDRIAVLHQAVRERGGRFAFSPEAALSHWNPSTRLPSVRTWFAIGRCFGEHRAKHEGWSAIRRASYTAAAPLVALMRLRSHWRSMRLAGKTQRETVGYYIVLALLISAVGFGESYGYVAGEGNAIDFLNDFEFRRDRFLVARDREAFLSEAIGR